MQTYESLLELVKDYQMSVWERRAQAISWSAGQIMCDRTGCDEWLLRRNAAEAWESLHRSSK